MARKTVPAGWQSARLVDMGGGLVTAISPDLLNDNEAQVAEYVDFSQKGTVKPCLGRRNRYASPFSSYPVMGMHSYYKKDGTSRLVIKAGDKIFYDKPHWVKVYDSETDWNEGTVANVSAAITPGDIVLANLAGPTFSRNSVAYLSDGTQVAANVPRFEPGKFAQAIMVEEGTTNLIKNASFEVYTGATGVADGWTSYVKSGTATFAVVTSPVRASGSRAQKIANSGMTAANDMTMVRQDITGISGGNPFSVSGYFYIESLTNAKVQLYLDFYDSAGAWLSKAGAEYTATTTGYVRLVKSGTTPTGAAKVTVHCILRATAAGGAGTIYVDDVQYEAKPYPTSIIFANDTTTQPTRSAETLTIPTAGVLSVSEGTVEFWFYVPTPSSNNIYIFDCYGGSNNDRILIYGASNALEALVGDGATYVTTSTISCQAGWNYIALRYGSFGVKFTVNATTVSAIGITKGPNTLAASAYLGSAYNGTFQAERALYDDIRISSCARTDAEISAAYQSGVPLEWDEWTTYLLPFDGNLNLPAARKGHWMSQVFDVSLVTDKASGQIAYEQDVPANTSVTYKSRSSSDQVTWSDWVEISPGGGLNHPANNYVQVMAVLSTTAYPATPAIHKATVSFDAVPQATELLSGLSASGEMFAETFNDLCIIVDGVDSPKKWDGVNAVTNLGGSPPAARYVAAHQNRLWLYGTVNNPSRLYFSELLDPENWPVLNFIDVSPDDGDKGTGLKPMQDVLVVFKQHATYPLVGDSIENFALRPRFPDKGCLSPRAVSVASNRLSLIDDRGVSLTDLTEVAVVTGRIEPSWKALNPRRLDQVLVVEDSSMLYIVGPGGVSTKNDTAFVLDLIRNCWSSKPNFKASCATFFREGGHQVLLFGDSTTGQVFSVDSTTELGNVVPMKWESKAFSFGSPERLKVLRRLFLQVKPGSVNGQIRVSLRVDLGTLSPSTVLDVPAGSGLLTLMVLAGALGVSTFHTVSVRVEAVTPGCLFEVHSIAFEYLPLGVMAEE